MGWRWRTAAAWIRRLNTAFGSSFLTLIVCIYWTQGFRALPWMAISYQLKDELKLTPSASQFAITVAFMPWNIKPLYGILSDFVPINGSRRISYLVLSSILSFIPWVLLGVFEMSTVTMIGLLTIQNFGTAMADVVIDAMIAEAARKERAAYAGDLHSMSWFAMALGGMLGGGMGGFALSSLGVKWIFLLFSMFPVLQLAVCMFVDEKKLANTIERLQNTDGTTSDVGPYAGGNHPGISNFVTSEQCDHSPLSKLTQSQNVDEAGKNGDFLGRDMEQRYTSVPEEDGEEVSSRVAKNDSSAEGSEYHPRYRTSLNAVEEHHGKSMEREAQDNSRPWVLTVKEAFFKLIRTVRKPVIQKPMLWFFLAQISVPSLSTIMFYYQTNHLHLDASIIGASRVVGWGSLMLGTFVYNQYLKSVSLSRILWWAHVMLALITLSNVILVSGMNRQLGIPNEVFIIGSSALGDAISQFKFMPFLVLSGQLCEPGIEGTLFSLFMSLNNIGSTLSSFFGASLASILRISSDQFENFSVGICIQAVFTLLPVLFLHLIPPNPISAMGMEKSK